MELKGTSTSRRSFEAVSNRIPKMELKDGIHPVVRFHTKTLLSAMRIPKMELKVTKLGEQGYAVTDPMNPKNGIESSQHDFESSLLQQALNPKNGIESKVW